jgi:hypothetical protein
MFMSGAVDLVPWLYQSPCNGSNLVVKSMIVMTNELNLLWNCSPIWPFLYASCSSEDPMVSKFIKLYPSYLSLFSRNGRVYSGQQLSFKSLHIISLPFKATSKSLGLKKRNLSVIAALALSAAAVSLFFILILANSFFCNIIG